MKKKPNKKNWKKHIKNKRIIASGIILILIIALAVYLIYNYNLNQEIAKTNKHTYDFLKCISECRVSLIIINNQTTERLDSECIPNCQTYYVSQIPEKFQNLDYIKSFGDRLLYNAEPLQACNIIIKVSQSYSSFNDCLSKVLPSLKEKYGIN
jgi:hypothetical protein